MRGRVSLTGQLASVDEDLTGRENLVLLGRLLGLRRARREGARRRAARGLRPHRGRRAAGQELLRAACAAGSTSPPASSSPRELMFLDEPTTGLDPRSRNQVWDIIRALSAGGHHDPALHPVPRGGRPARRRHRRDRPRQGDRRGHAGPAQGVGRLRRAPRAPARPRPAPARPSSVLGARSARVNLEPDPAALSVGCADAEQGRRGASPSSPGRACGWPTSRSASPASTRSSWR